MVLYLLNGNFDLGNDNGKADMKNRLKYYVPATLFGRFLLIILIPTILAQGFAVYMFYHRHWDTVSRHMSRFLAGEIVLISHAFVREKYPDQRQALLEQAREHLYFSIIFQEGARLERQVDRSSPYMHDLYRQLDDRLGYPYRLYYDDEENVVARIGLPEGVLEFNASRKRLFNPSTYIFVMWMVGTAIFLVIIAIIFMKNQVRAITRLAEEAERFGRGIESDTAFRPHGAAEVRKAAYAFLQMKERIGRYIQQRTIMLAGVSHDLKTPLTRMKLQLAMMEKNTETQMLQEEVVNMERMVGGYLDFAKGEDLVPEELVHVMDMLRSIIATYRNDHHRIILQGEDDVIIPMHKQAFFRVVTNIIDNGLRYGHQMVITLTLEASHINLFFDDDGCGIDEHQKEEVFKPFYRLDPSRNSETGGTGLGLAIVKDLLMRLGGDVRLSDSPQGGLRVAITFLR